MTNSNLKYFDKSWIKEDKRVLETDIVVYGGTAAGLMAAIEAKRQGLKVLLCHPGIFLGGLTTGGLGFTDFGNRHIIGGLAGEFYQKVGKAYGTERCYGFEPKVASQIFQNWLDEEKIEVLKKQFLAEVVLEDKKISSVSFLGGLRIKAKGYIDTTYEGDLMAKAGVSFTVGREGNQVYGETHNGAQLHPSHQFLRPVDPYVVPGKQESGLLPGISASVVTQGEGDDFVQAYNFRVCMTDDPNLRVAFPKPDNYQASDYELLHRYLIGMPGWRREDPQVESNDRFFNKFDRLHVKSKTDTNNHGPVSTDFIGGSWNWPKASYEERELIFQQHVTYQQGYHYYMSTDPSVPKDIQQQYQKWGLAKDEFLETGHWSHSLYIREARRMVSDLVITEDVCEGKTKHSQIVGMGAYQMDSHHVRRVVVNGSVRNEGDVQKPIPAPYGIPFQAIVPKRSECENLCVPVCLSASHIAFGSIRMEPVFMILAQSGMIALAIALKNKQPVQAIDTSAYEKALLSAGQVLKTDKTNNESGNP